MTFWQRFKLRLKTFGTIENFILKSIIGFLSGVCLTYLFYLFFILQLNFSYASATAVCSVLGFFFTLGLAFSVSMRCLVLMVMPQLFSRTGRQALVAYAYILVLTGPGRNTLHNTRVLTDSLVCNQEKLKKVIKSAVDAATRPIVAIKNALDEISDKIAESINKAKYLAKTMQRSVSSLVSVFTSAFKWLNGIVMICNKKMGTPYEKCIKDLEDSVDQCKAQLGPALGWFCSPSFASTNICSTLKVVEYLCEAVDFISDGVVQNIKKKMAELAFHLKNIFYVSIKFSHEYKFETSSSKNISDVTAGIAGEIRRRTNAILYLFDWMSFAFSFFFLLIIYKTLSYRRQFLVKEWYDNRYITANFIKIDIRRTYLRKETILPLTLHESQKYIKIDSFHLVKSEKQTIAKTAVFLALATIKLSIHMLADYSIYWLLMMIRMHGDHYVEFNEFPEVEVQFGENGIVSDVYRSIAKSFKPHSVDNNVTACLPNPRVPDWNIYKQIVSLIVLFWIFSLLEPYGLRLRNWVMCYYYPMAARNRSIWLYNFISHSRSFFVKLARRQLRKRFGLNYREEKFSFTDKLAIRFPRLAKFLGIKKKEVCLLCGLPSLLPLIHCEKLNCLGTYCNDCYADLENVCTICEHPVTYGDVSDISEEKDSSEDEHRYKKLGIFKGKWAAGIKSSEAIGEEEALLGDESISYSYQNRKRSYDDKPVVDITDLGSEDGSVVMEDIFEESDSERELDEKRTFKMNLAERKDSSILHMFSNSRLAKLKGSSKATVGLPNVCDCTKNDSSILLPTNGPDKFQNSEPIDDLPEKCECIMLNAFSAISYGSKIFESDLFLSQPCTTNSSTLSKIENTSSCKTSRPRTQKKSKKVCYMSPSSDSSQKTSRFKFPRIQKQGDLVEPESDSIVIFSTDNNIEEHRQMLSVLAPSYENSALDLTKIEAGVQTEVKCIQLGATSSELLLPLEPQVKKNPRNKSPIMRLFKRIKKMVPALKKKRYIYLDKGQCEQDYNSHFWGSNHDIMDKSSQGENIAFDESNYGDDELTVHSSDNTKHHRRTETSCS